MGISRARKEASNWLPTSFSDRRALSAIKYPIRSAQIACLLFRARLMPCGRAPDQIASIQPPAPNTVNIILPIGR